MRDVVRYAIGFGPLGELAAPAVRPARRRGDLRLPPSGPARRSLAIVSACRAARSAGDRAREPEALHAVAARRCGSSAELLVGLDALGDDAGAEGPADARRPPR